MSDELIELENEYPEFKSNNSPSQKVGGTITKNFETVKHSIPMLSLSNTYSDEELNDFDKRVKKNLNTDKVSQIVKDIKDLKKEFTKTIEKFSNIPSSRIGEIELSILYLALYEISLSQLDEPIIINEAIKLAKKFGQTSSHKFVNAILDKAIKES